MAELCQKPDWEGFGKPAAVRATLASDRMLLSSRRFFTISSSACIFVYILVCICMGVCTCYLIIYLARLAARFHYCACSFTVCWVPVLTRLLRRALAGPSDCLLPRWLIQGHGPVRGGVGACRVECGCGGHSTVNYRDALTNAGHRSAAAHMKDETPVTDHPSLQPQYEIIPRHRRRRHHHHQQ